MNTALFSSLGRYKDLGLFLLRAILGTMFVLHGYPKLLGGPQGWEGLGGAAAYVGITFAPKLWGFLAAVAETLGGAFLVLGLLTRPAAMALTATMVVAAAMHLGRGDGLMGAAHAIETGAACLALIFLGPGRLSLDRK